MCTENNSKHSSVYINTFDFYNNLLRQILLNIRKLSRQLVNLTKLINGKARI